MTASNDENYILLAHVPEYLVEMSLFWRQCTLTPCEVRNVFGGASNNEGMGLLSWCLDWNLIGSNCLYNPLWLQINQDIGIFFTYILMSAVYYGNLWNAKQFPFMSQAIFVRVFRLNTLVQLLNPYDRLQTARSTTRLLY